jgi:acetolactate decarboxylase
MNELGEQIDQHIRSTNLFYAIRIHGNFSELTTRAIPKLFPPYPPLSEAIDQQVKFSFQNIEGTLVAFRSKASTRSGITITSSRMMKLSAATR